MSWRWSTSLGRGTSPVTIAPADQAVWEEYGLEVAEQAQYPGWTGIGYRLKDPTSAFGV